MPNNWQIHTPSMPKKEEKYEFGFNLMKEGLTLKTKTNRMKHPVHLFICLFLVGREGGTIANYYIYQTKIYDTEILFP